MTLNLAGSALLRSVVTLRFILGLSIWYLVRVGAFALFRYSEANFGTFNILTLNLAGSDLLRSGNLSIYISQIRVGFLLCASGALLIIRVLPAMSACKDEVVSVLAVFQASARDSSVSVQASGSEEPGLDLHHDIWCPIEDAQDVEHLRALIQVAKSELRECKSAIQSAHSLWTGSLIKMHWLHDVLVEAGWEFFEGPPVLLKDGSIFSGFDYIADIEAVEEELQVAYDVRPFGELYKNLHLACEHRWH